MKVGLAGDGLARGRFILEKREARSEKREARSEKREAARGAVSETAPHAVFMLWGNFAQGKRALIEEEKHLVLCANHPSPLSALRPPVPFIGCGHFGAANTWLAEHGLRPVDWTI